MPCGGDGCPNLPANRPEEEPNHIPAPSEIPALEESTATTMLFIDCVPLGMPAPLLGDVVAHLVDAFFDEKGTVPGGWSDYGVTGWHHITTALRKRVENGEVDLPEVLLAGSRDPQPLLEYLTQCYDVVVKGI